MTETPTDLASWLTAVWDEEERLATKAGGDRWILDGGIVHESHPSDDVVDWVYGGADEHIAYHDPASVLARIAADRKILALHVGGVSYPDECGLCNESLPCETVRLLASPHVDRPGLRPEWLVERQGVEG